jgi:sterol desaturase/sphingolipid hydroxylase (fatty acid hydroxylase superfamily)
LLFFWKQKEVLREQFSKRILFHPSARLDYLYFVVVSLVKFFLIIPFVLGVNEVSLWCLLQIQDIFGYVERIRVSKVGLIFAYTLVLFVVNDFTRYLLHRLMHQNTFLWRFHQLHHSAEVLNPLTFYRVHPLENVLFGFRYAFSTGFVTAWFIYFFGAGIGLVEIFGVNVLVFFFLALGSNLRHSHIPLSYGNRIEKWIISPFQHQLHHTAEDMNKNFGSNLALWDNIFKTLKTSASKIEKPLVFGLKKEKIKHSLLGAFLNPFHKGVQL